MIHILIVVTFLRECLGSYRELVVLHLIDTHGNYSLQLGGKCWGIGRCQRCEADSRRKSRARFAFARG